MGLPQKSRYDIKDYASRRDVFEAFFQDHADFFDTAAKKAVFMVGYLAQRLLNIQRNKYDENTPFKARLKGMKLKDRDVRRLYYEIINKLEEYKSNYYKQEEGLCAEYLIESGDDWNMLDEDISFYTALGMNMLHCFILKDEDESKNRSDSGLSMIEEDEK